jgi:uracil-DNA glycosylase
MKDLLFFSTIEQHYPELAERMREDSERLCPKLQYVFKAFDLCELSKTKVVILGQDPYHTPGKANGLAFGYHEDYKSKPVSSLRNIVDEVYRSTGQTVTDTTLESWAKQGVLLLNTRLTTTEGQPMAHAGLGWEDFVEEVIIGLNSSANPIVWMLWGNEAKAFKDLIDNPHHLILDSSHPSSYSYKRGFEGCDHFNRANEFLIERNKPNIRWGEFFQ